MAIVQGQKYQWRLPVIDQTKALTLAMQYNISLPLASTLLTRGLETSSAIERYLFSTYEKDVFSGELLKDGYKAVDRIISAIDRKEKILIFGDYDVDGITSSALMMLCLVPLGANVNFFLPHRARDGYGLSLSIVERAANNKYNLLITVDNGITAFEPAKKARELGLDLIITDHHRPHEHLPEAFAVINPHQLLCSYPFKFFAGVGVVFKVMQLLYDRLGKQLPEKVYELLLLGTVADVVPLIGENRFWVRYCLNKVNQKTSFALTVLKNNGKVSQDMLKAMDVGFALAPQLNALGRLQDPRQGVHFLIGNDEQEIIRVGQLLSELNQVRKEVERDVLNDVITEIEQKRINLDHELLICAASENWPSGVIGLVASRLVGMYYRPTMLFHVTEDGIAKGSCRSIPEFNMFEALSSCRDILLSFGGHAVAAGLSITIENLPILKNRLEEMIKQTVPFADLQPKIAIDSELRLGDMTAKIMHDMNYFEPFGNQNPMPLFWVRRTTLVQKPVLLKDAHVKCLVFADGVAKPVIFFNRPELMPFLRLYEQEEFDLIAHVKQNIWNGNTTIELQGIDIALSSAIERIQ